MSSSYVRTTIKNFLEAETDETVVDLTALFQEIKELISELEIQPDAPWLGISFIGGEEIPVCLTADNEKGKYRETGAIYFHVVDVARLGAGNGLLTRGEALRNLFRGRRIGDIIVESITTMNFDSGATLEFEGGYMSGSFQLAYQYDRDL